MGVIVPTGFPILNLVNDLFFCDGSAVLSADESHKSADEIVTECRRKSQPVQTK